MLPCKLTCMTDVPVTIITYIISIRLFSLNVFLMFCSECYNVNLLV